MPVHSCLAQGSASGIVIIVKNDFLIASRECLVVEFLFVLVWSCILKDPKYPPLRIHQVLGEEANSHHCSTKENPRNSNERLGSSQGAADHLQGAFLLGTLP